jgi:hypothetical protein
MYAGQVPTSPVRSGTSPTSPHSVRGPKKTRLRPPTGIDAKSNDLKAGQDPWHADPDRILIANQSEAWVLMGGMASIPRL